MQFRLIAITFLLVSTASPEASAQNQLVLLKGEKVILRLYPGDEIELRMKNSDDKIYSYINNLFDTALLAHETLIPFSRIDRIYFERTSFMNRVGKGLIIGGVGYFLIDQLNTVVVQGEEMALDENVTRASVTLVAVGLPMALIKKKSQRLKAGYRLLTAKPDSPFYRRVITTGL